jgi:hypothetical protein
VRALDSNEMGYSLLSQKVSLTVVVASDARILYCPTAPAQISLQSFMAGLINKSSASTLSCCAAWKSTLKPQLKASKFFETTMARSLPVAFDAASPSPDTGVGMVRILGLLFKPRITLVKVTLSSFKPVA